MGDLSSSDKTVAAIHRLVSGDNRFMGIKVRTLTALAAIATICGVIIGVTVPLVTNKPKTTPTSASLSPPTLSSGPITASTFTPAPQQGAVPTETPTLASTPAQKPMPSISPAPANTTSNYCFDGTSWCAKTDKCKSNSTQFSNLTECCGALDISKNLCINRNTLAFPNCSNVTVNTYGVTRKATIMHCVIDPLGDGCLYDSCKVVFSTLYIGLCNPLLQASAPKDVYNDLYTCCITYSTEGNRCVTSVPSVFSYCKSIGLSYEQC